MSLNNHPDYHEELQRVHYTIEYVTNVILAMESKRSKYNEEMRQAYIDFDFLDSSLSYVRIMMNSKFLENLEKSYDGLVRAQTKPYFCRIDITVDGTKHPLKLYIGKTALPRVEEGESPLIVDWRSPIASVYYDGNLGHVSYNTPSGIQEGELHLKRQYTINNSKLENIMDVDFTATDTFLQAALEENKDNRLKDIVSTIQAEQNEIIRAAIECPLIVQGAAGSGKTTIALHRIAYLIYTYESSFRPDNFLIIAPNQLFLNYISEVLPELGVEQVKQTTFIDLVQDLSGIKYKLVSPDEKLLMLLKPTADEQHNSLLPQVSAFKGSLDFRNLIDQYGASLEKSFTPDQDFKLEHYIIMTADEVRNLFLNDLFYLPLYSRIPSIKKLLSHRLKKELVSIVEEVEDHYETLLKKLRNTALPAEEKRKILGKLMEERQEKIDSLKRSAKTAVAKFISLFPKHDVMHHYTDLISNPEYLQRFGNNLLDGKFLAYFCSHNTALLNKNRIEFEDLTGILYLQHKIFGLKKEMKIKYVVIDEAQDFSIFQISTLKEIFNTEMFTMLGDLAQGIHSYRGINAWNEVMEKVFINGNCRYLTLEQSYRTTIEIMDLANAVIKMSKLPDLVLAKPVVRHGAKPNLFRLTTQKEMLNVLEKRVQQLRAKDYDTIAIICKTASECALLKKMVDKRGSFLVKQLSADDLSYEGGIVIVSAYHAKGLEFDAVIIATLEEDYPVKELDLKLLYVAMTRALHSLDIICCASTLTCLEDMNESLYSAII